jgi:hypothetical protein
MAARGPSLVRPVAVLAAALDIAQLVPTPEPLGASLMLWATTTLFPECIFYAIFGFLLVDRQALPIVKKGR